MTRNWFLFQFKSIVFPLIAWGMIFYTTLGGKAPIGLKDDNVTRTMPIYGF